MSTADTGGSGSATRKAGLILAGLVSLVNAPSALFPTPEGQVGPPLPILLVSSAVGLAGLLFCVLAWRGSAGAARTLAVLLAIGVLVTLPAFFADIPAFLRLLAALFTIASVAAVALMFAGRRQPA